MGQVSRFANQDAALHNYLLGKVHGNRSQCDDQRGLMEPGLWELVSNPASFPWRRIEKVVKIPTYQLRLWIDGLIDDDGEAIRQFQIGHGVAPWVKAGVYTADRAQELRERAEMLYPTA